jgi:hypothetical protein
LTNAGHIQADGLDIATANNSWPCVCDWNNDGRKDLLVGQEGIGSPCNVYLYLNQGADSLPVFGDSIPVLAGGVPINNYRCVPLALDLDGDSRKDLVLGEWYSSVRLYHNTGTDANPVFASFVNLVPPDPDSFLNGNPPRVNFTDWDGDGDLDMITCDYYGSVFLRRNITPVAVGEAGSSRVGIALSIAPNPVTNRAFFSIRVAHAGVVDVGVYSSAGRRIATPWHGYARAGELCLRCDMRAVRNAVSDGVCLVRVRAGTEVLGGKLLLTR